MPIYNPNAGGGSGGGGAGYPLRVGDTYQTNAGPIDPLTDIEVKAGVTYTSSDYPNLSGSLGYPVSNDPNGFDVNTFESGNISSVESIFSPRNQSGYVIGNQSSLQQYSDPLDNSSVLNTIATSEAKYSTHVYYGDDKVLVAGDLSKCYIVDFTTNSSTTITGLGRGVGTSNKIAVSENLVIAAPNSSGSSVSFTNPGGITVAGSVSDNVNTVGELIASAYLKSTQEFFFTVFNADVATVIKTSDFVSFTGVTSGLPTPTTYGSLFYTDSTVYFFDFDSTSVYACTDGINWSFRGNTPVVGSQFYIGVVGGTDEVLSIKNNANKSTYISLDQGVTWEVLSSPIAQSYAVAYSSVNNRFYVTRGNSTRAIAATLPAQTSFKTPVPNNTGLNKTYVKAK